MKTFKRLALLSFTSLVSMSAMAKVDTCTYSNSPYSDEFLTTLKVEMMGNGKVKIQNGEVYKIENQGKHSYDFIVNYVVPETDYDRIVVLRYDKKGGNIFSISTILRYPDGVLVQGMARTACKNRY